MPVSLLIPTTGALSINPPFREDTKTLTSCKVALLTLGSHGIPLEIAKDNRCACERASELLSQIGNLGTEAAEQQQAGCRTTAAAGSTAANRENDPESR